MARAFILFGGLLCLLPPWPALHWPGLPAWGGLLAGIVVALTLGNPWSVRTRPLVSILLAWAVAGLGAAMDLRAVVAVGLQGFGYTAVGIALTLGLGLLLGRWLAVKGTPALLVSLGTAICGGSAIAAAAPVLQADEADTGVALATVFLLNAAALLLFPWVGHLLALDPRAFGLWSALAIHDTSSVVGAASTFGPEALLVGTTTKLARALWIVPVTLALGVWVARRTAGEARPVKARRPWFILAFLGAAALVTFLPALQPAGQAIAGAARRLLVLTLFLLGLGFSRETLRKVGPRPLLHGLLLWLLVGAATLAAIRAGWVR